MIAEGRLAGCESDSACEPPGLSQRQIASVSHCPAETATQQ